MEKRTYRELEEVAQEGLAVLRETLKERKTDDADLTLARLAVTSVSNFARVYQANSAREATLVSIVGQAAGGSDEFRRLIMASLPGSAVTKALRAADGKEAKQSIPQLSTAKLSQA